ncbi:MAG: TIR domain-containing protein, partial [Proteobacteria bacterium]|nr:TIR domain-containing protein [Pseudomonadota bacterium]
MTKGSFMAGAGKIFINYRRGDDPGATGRLFDRLQTAFKSEQLFMDVEGGIAAGADFVDVLREQVSYSDILLAVIGQKWLSIIDEQGRSRLDNPDDFVRIEIAAAMEQGKLVIPVLVGGAGMPTADQLPDELKPLARRNAVRLTHERFQADCAGLIKSLETQLAKAIAAREERAATAARAAADAERTRAEAAQRQRQEDAERQRERARLEAAANLTPDQIAKAEELANWDFIKESTNPQEFRDHLARFPSGVTLRMARARLATIEWTALGRQATRTDLEAYLQEFADGPHSASARAAIDALDLAADAERRLAAEAKADEERAAREAAAWDVVKNSTDIDTIQAFLRDWPSGRHADEARRLRRAMGGETADRRWSIAGLVFASIYPVALGLVWTYNQLTGRALKPFEQGFVVAIYPALIMLIAALLLRGRRMNQWERACYWAGTLPLVLVLYRGNRSVVDVGDANQLLPEVL